MLLNLKLKFENQCPRADYMLLHALCSFSCFAAVALISDRNTRRSWTFKIAAPPVCTHTHTQSNNQLHCSISRYPFDGIWSGLMSSPQISARKRKRWHLSDVLWSEKGCHSSSLCSYIHMHYLWPLFFLWQLLNRTFHFISNTLEVIFRFQHQSSVDLVFYYWR